MASIDIVFILDASGSMGHLVNDTVGGVNRFLEEQRQIEGEAYISLVTFDNIVKERFAAKLLRYVPSISADEYYRGHGGGTALLDAVGQTVTRYASFLTKADKTVFVITTDGAENCSREFKLDDVRALIEKYQAENGWAFVFLGANASAWQGAAMGSQTSGSYVASSAGTRAVYGNLSANVATMRSSGASANATGQTLKWDTSEE